MKKLYLFLVAMLVSLTASAVDYYLIGGFNGWTLKDANYKFAAGSNGEYTLDVAKLTSDFKINDGTWNNDAPNFGSNGTDLVTGTVYSLGVGSSTGNISISKDIENAHLVFNPTAKTLLITGQSVEAVYTYQIWGEVKTGVSGNWQAIDFTEEDGVWVYSGALKPGNFGIRQMNGTSQTKWYSADGSSTIGTAQLGQPLPVKVEGTNWNSSLNGNFKVVFDVNALTLTITSLGDGPLPPTPVVVPNNLYLIGNLSSGSWVTSSAPAMTKEGNRFSIEGVTIANGGEDGFFSFITATGSNWDAVNSSDRYGSATTNQPIVLDEPTAIVKYEVGVNASSATSWKIAEGTYNFMVDFDTMTVTVTQNGDNPNPPTPEVPAALYLIGNLSSGSWNTATAPAMTKDGNMFTISDVQLGTTAEGEAYFTFLTATGKDWDAVNSSDRYGAPAPDTPLTSGAPAAMVKYAVGVNASDAKSWMVPNGIYTITADFDNMTVTATKTADIEPVEEVITYDILGGVEGSPWSAITMTEDENGIWTATKECSAFEFGIRKLNNGEQVAWYSAPVGNSTIGEAQLGQALTLASSDNENFKFTLDGTFTFALNPVDMKLTITGDVVVVPPTPEVAPEALYLVGNLSTGSWDTATAPAMTKGNNKFTISGVQLGSIPEGDSYFSFLTATGKDWDEVNGSDRYGADADNTALASGEPATMVKYAAGVNASSASSWKVANGIYTITADFDNMTVTATKTGDIEQPIEDEITYDIWGGVSGGSWSAIELTKGDGGIWTATKECSAFEFGIRKLNNGEQVAWYSAPVGNSTIGEAQLGQALTLASSDNENFKFTLDGTFTFALNPADMKLTITGDVVVVPPTPEVAPEALYLVGNLSTGSWNTATAPAMTKENNVFTIKGVEFVDAANGNAYFSFLTATGEDWDTVNKSDRYGAATPNEPISADVPATMVKYTAEVNASSAASWQVAAGTYDVTADFNTMTVTLKASGIVVPPTPDKTPDALYLIGNLSTGAWDTVLAPAMTKDGDKFTINDVELVAADANEYAYFSFLTATGADWGEVNGSDRYGAAEPDTMLDVDTPSAVVKYAAGVNASSAASWKVAPGKYNVTVNFEDMTVTLVKSASGVNGINVEDGDVQYFDLSGLRVVNPASGKFYIVRRGGKVTKEVVR